MKRTFAVLLAVSIPLGGCASSSLLVEKPNIQRVHASAVTLAYDNSTADVPQDAISYLTQRMQKEFYEGDNPIFARGDELTIRYRFIGYSEGSRIGRWATGGLAGGSNMTVEADFVDRSGAVVATVRSSGEVRGGVFGGSSKSGIDRAVKEIAQYAVLHFKA